MKNMFQRFYDDERGVTALETAIILIAFVVVAAVFAFTILSTGTFMTERSKEAAYSGLAQVRGSMELKGSVVGFGIVDTDPVSSTLQGVSFTVANVAGGEAIDFTPPNGDVIAPCEDSATDNAPTDISVTEGKNVVNISLRDSAQNVLIPDWAVCSIGYSNENNMLEDRELFKIYVPVNDTNASATVADVGPSKNFAVEIKPPSGAVLVLQRVTPPTIEDVMDFK